MIVRGSEQDATGQQETAGHVGLTGDGRNSIAQHNMTNRLSKLNASR